MEGTGSSSSLRWKILRQALLRKSDLGNHSRIKRISRKPTQGFSLIPFQLVGSSLSSLKGDISREMCVCYTLPIDGSPKLYLIKRVDNFTDLGDFEISNQYNIDNTGLVCKFVASNLIDLFLRFMISRGSPSGQWPSEDVLAYFCMTRPENFRSKRVIELGSGYGLAGLVIAAATEASEVVISDGNPQVVDYIRRNIESNFAAFGATNVRAMSLHWNQEQLSTISNAFDVIIASDCTFFKEFHKHLARIVKTLLKNEGPSEAIFFSPRRGDSLEKFLKEAEEARLHYNITENYDAEVYKRHDGLLNGDDSWPNYEKDNCYPLLIRITH